MTNRISIWYPFSFDDNLNRSALWGLPVVATQSYRGILRVKMEIKAFKAYRFNEAVVGDVGSCIAPPYDVIDADLQDRLYKKSKYNIAQITKGKTTPSDSPDNNQYTRAAKLINDWFQTGDSNATPMTAFTDMSRISKLPA